MMNKMLCPGHDLEVAERIVERVVVDVVDDLVSGKTTAEMVFNDGTMLGNFLAIPPDIAVPLIEK